MSTLDKLEQLNTENPTRTPFLPDFEKLVVPVLLDFPQFIQVGLIKPEFFSQLTTRWVVAEILNYHEQHGVVPTRPVIRDVLVKKVTEDDPYEEIFALVDTKPNPRDVPYVKDQLKKWLRDRAYGQIYSTETLEAYHRGDYATLEDLIKRANRIYNFEQGEPFGFMDAIDFLAKEFKTEWLIEGVLVHQQAMLMGGKKKCLKTAILCDLAVSLATGTPFLGHFRVPQPRRVAFFSAESGEHDIHARLHTIYKEKGGTLQRGYLWPSFDRPQLSSEEDLAKIRDFVEQKNIEVVIVDPLYLTLLAGGDRDTAASDLYQMGRVFGDVADCIIKAGATPILCHHFKKTVTDNGLDLDDFAMTGAAEFARQSILIARYGEYTGPEDNNLVIRTHGFGRGDRFAVHINEGQDDNRKWEVRVEREAEAVVRATVTRLDGALQKLVEYLTEKGPSSKNQIRKELGINDEKFRTLQTLSNGRVEEFQDGSRRLFRLAD